MSAGRMNELVTLEWLGNEARSESGARREDWVAGDQVWCEIEDLRGSLYFAADQVNSKTTARVRMYIRDDVANATGKTLRLNQDGKIYTIEGSPIRLRNRMQLELMVYERV